MNTDTASSASSMGSAGCRPSWRSVNPGPARLRVPPIVATVSADGRRRLPRDRRWGGASRLGHDRAWTDLSPPGRDSRRRPSRSWTRSRRGRRVRGRADSTWDVPEPELTLGLDARARIVGYTIGNDVSSRSIEGENTLYLPQAKTYDGSCAIGPAIVPVGEVEPPFTIRMTIERDSVVVYDDDTTTSEMRRSFEELAGYLGRALTFPVGAL